MYKNHHSLLHNLGVIVLFIYLHFVQGININITRDINLQPFLYKRLFGEHPSVLLILLLYAEFQ